MKIAQAHSGVLPLILGIALAMPFVARAQEGLDDPIARCHGQITMRGADPERGPHRDGGAGMPPLPPAGHLGLPLPLDDLGLTEEQEDKVFAVLHEQAPFLRDQEKIVRKSHEQLRVLSQSSLYDDAAARRLAEAGAKAMAELALQQARGARRIFELLTPEQRRRSAEAMAQGRGPRPQSPAGMPLPNRR